MNTEHEPETRVPTGTLVFGLIICVIAVVVLSRSLLHISLDMPLLLIIVVAVAGVILIISGVASALKRAGNKDREHN